MRVPIFLALTLVLSGCLSPGHFDKCSGADATWSAASGTICVDSQERAFLLTVPEGDGPWPLLIALHGGGGNAENMERKTRLDDLATQEGFVLMVPDGTPNLRGGSIRTWNAGYCCGVAKSAATDDVAFLEALIEAAQAEFAIDSDRIGVTGHSNGGMMAHKLAAESALVTHAMPVAGTIGGRAPVDAELETLGVPVGAPPEILIMHATDDPRVPYNGGMGQNLGEQRDDQSVEEAREYWESHGASVTILQTEGGHGWPGGEADIAQGPSSPDASAVIVEFLFE